VPLSNDTVLTRAQQNIRGHMSLTQKSIAQLKAPVRKPGAKNPCNEIHFDTELPGFGARITEQGVVSFVLTYRTNGRQRCVTIGRASEMSVAAAREEAIKLRSEIRSGSDPLARREHSRIASPMIKDLAARYLTDHAVPHKRPASVYNDRGMLDGIVLPKMGSLQIAAITRMDVENLHRSLSGTPFRANRTLSLLSKMFSLAVQWQWRTDNPAKGVKKFDEDQRTACLDREEITRLLAVLNTYTDTTSARVVRLLLYTGARKGEALAARWENINLTTERWTKLKENTKQKRQHVVPLSSEAVKFLRKMHREAGEPKEGYVFPGRSEGTHLENIKSHWDAIRTAAKLGEDFRVHDLRHTFASDLVSGGQSLETVGALLGHSTIAMTQRYSHLSDGALRVAVNTFMK